VKAEAALAMDRAGEASERYRKGPAEYFVASMNPPDLQAVVLFCARTGRSWLLPSAKSDLLSRLDRFRTLPEHREALRLAPGSTDLQDFADAGLLTRESELREALAAGGRAEPSEERDPGAAGPIGTVVFVTRDRAASLERAVVSAVANARRHDRVLEVVVIDDSRGAEAQAANRSALARVTGAAAIRYAGIEERQAYAERVGAMCSEDTKLATFALLGHPKFVTTGAARNCALLDQVGSRFVLADDDVHWQTTERAQPDAPLAVCEETDPTRVWFHASHDELLADLRLGHEDVMGAHERLLGHTLAGLLQSWRSTVDITELGDLLEARLRRQPARVRVTTAGGAGDSGLDDPDYLDFDAESSLRLCRDEDFFQQVWRSRQMVRVAPRPTLTVPRHLLGFNIGLDGAQLLPPFPPVQRNPERIFGHLLLRCFGEALQGHLDFGLLHQPPEPRVQDVEAWRASKGQLTFSRLLESAVGAAQVRFAATPARELREVGVKLFELAKEEPPDFAAEIRRAVWKDHQGRGFGVQRRYHEMPPLLQRRMAEAQGLSQRSLHLPGYWIPRDLPPGDGSQSAGQRAQHLFHWMGSLLIFWEPLWRAAQKLREQGVRLAQPLR
jgi:hypothetical protein